MSRYRKLFNSVCDVKIMHYSTPKEIKNSQFHPDLKNKCPDNLTIPVTKTKHFFFSFLFLSSFPPSFPFFFLMSIYLLLVFKVLLSKRYFYLVQAAPMAAQ